EPKLAEILDKAQLDRLKQIRWQTAGAQIYSDPEFVQALALTKEQQEKAAEINREAMSKAAELFRSPAGDRDENRKKREEITRKRDTELEKLLTADQKKKLEEAKGKPFDVSSLRPRFSREERGGRRGGDRPRRDDPSKENSPKASKEKSSKSDE